jgi:hypothetical protein
MQQPAKPCTPVRFRPPPPYKARKLLSLRAFLFFILEHDFLNFQKITKITCFDTRILSSATRPTAWLWGEGSIGPSRSGGACGVVDLAATGIGGSWYMTDAAQKEEDVSALRYATAGPGNLRYLFMYAPGGKEKGIQSIPISEVSAKDEFFNIKNVTRDDVLAAHRRSLSPAAVEHRRIRRRSQGGRGVLPQGNQAAANSEREALLFVVVFITSLLHASLAMRSTALWRGGSVVMQQCQDTLQIALDRKTCTDIHCAVFRHTSASLTVG